QRRPRWLPERRGAVLVSCLGAALVALHLPALYSAHERALRPTNPNFPVVMLRSECEAIRRCVGDEPVDTWVGDLCDSCLVVQEFSCKGYDVRLGWPAYERTLNNYAALCRCPRPTYPPDKARYSIVEANAYAPPGTVVYQGRRFKVIEAAHS